METVKFKKGQDVHLDEVYEIIGMIPLDAYQQYDPIDGASVDEETITFKRNVEIKYSVKVT